MAKLVVVDIVLELVVREVVVVEIVVVEISLQVHKGQEIKWCSSFLHPSSLQGISQFVSFE